MKFLDYNGLQYFWSKLKVLFQSKQDTLVSGTNVKTIGGQSILGSGNIQVGDENAVKFVSQSLTSEQQTQARTNIGSGTYSKPSGGIPISDLVSGVQTSLGKADSAYQKPFGGIPASDIASGVIPDVSGKQDTLVSGTNIKTVNGESILGSGNITAGDTNAVQYVAQTLTDAQKTQARTNIGAAAASALSALETAIAAKYSKPSGGIPETDLASAVQSALALARTSIQSLADYYSKTEVDALLDAVGSEQYVDVTTLPTASASTLGKIYLVGPDANGFYDRYYTSYDGSTYSWVPAGNTEINLANYATKEEVSQLQQKVGDLSQLMTEDKTSLVAAINESGFSGAAKTALVELLRKVAFIDEDGQDYLNALYAYLFPNMLSIDAVFTQGQATIYESDDLATLKQYLVVTALYQDGTSLVLPDNAYTLFGTLVEGESEITVTYGNLSDTFEVLVAATPREVLFGVFVEGYTTPKGLADGIQKIYRSTLTARATTHDPCINRGYIFTVTDSSKYNIAIYDIQSLDKLTTNPPAGAIDGYYYAGGNKTISWKTEDSASTPYIWIVLKKMDGTAFTAEELADGAAAVFNYTKAN